MGQLSKLLQGKHPRTGDELPPPKRRDGTLWTPSMGKYLELKDKGCEVTDDKFYRYVPEVLKIRQLAERVVEHTTVQEEAAERRDRVKKREAESIRASSVDNYVQERLANKLRQVPLRETAGEQQETHPYHGQQPLSKIPTVIRPSVPTRMVATRRRVLEPQEEVQAACGNFPSSTLAGVVPENCSKRPASAEWEVSAARRRSLVGNGGGKGREKPPTSLQPSSLSILVGVATPPKGRALAGLLARDGETGLNKTRLNADEGNAAKVDESNAAGGSKKVFADLLGKAGIAEQKVIASKLGGRVSDKIRRHCGKTGSCTDMYGANRARSDAPNSHADRVKRPSAESAGGNVGLGAAKRTRQNSRELDLWD